MLKCSEQVREATNDDPWGPSGQQMQEIAGCTFTYEAFPEVMGMLWKRMLHDNKQNWRRIYKSLLLLDYLIKETFNNILFFVGFFTDLTDRFLIHWLDGQLNFLG